MIMDKCTLLVRHLPDELSPNDAEELLKMFGASAVQYFPRRSKMKSHCIAGFKNAFAAEVAMHRLHQLEILGHRLVVEFSEKTCCASIESSELNAKLEIGENRSDGKISNVTQDASGLNLNFVAEDIGLKYPFSPRLRYSYPPPNPAIVNNIAAALISVPKFYYQVLHLMNKFNLPPPFGAPIFHAQHLLAQHPGVVLSAKESKTLNSEEESELESDDDVGNSALDSLVNLIPEKRKKTIRRTAKRPRLLSLLPLPVVTAPQEGVPASVVFEVPDVQVQKKIEFKISAPVSSSGSQELEENKGTGNFGTFSSADAIPSDSQNLDELSENVDRKSDFITEKELRENRISSDGMSLLPVFKNYQPGKPSDRLYLKNLPKQVEEKDLKFIYGRYVDHTSEEEKQIFNIRLMKEGRMKGQAFITLPNEHKATTALNDTNGYMLLGKPIVVQFAHSGGSKRNNNNNS